MANIVVMEFSRLIDELGTVSWPAKTTTRLETPASIDIPRTTAMVVITCDSDVRMTFDEVDPTAADIPLLSSIQNQFRIREAATLMFA